LSPGETFDMTRVKISQRRLQGLEYFSARWMRVPRTRMFPTARTCSSGVEEQRTGKMSFGAGFSSIDSLGGVHVEVTQGNFDLFHPPNVHRVAGRSSGRRLQVGTERQDYVLSLTEPWFLDQKLSTRNGALSSAQMNYQSIGNLYDEVRTGMRVSSARPCRVQSILDRDFGPGDLVGTVYYNIENAGILLDDGLHGNHLQFPIRTDPNLPP
jgi:outer membrane protein insertion porin family